MNNNDPYIVIDLSSENLLQNSNMASKISIPFEDWCLEHDLTDDSITKLKSEGFTTVNLLAMAEPEDVCEMKIKPKAQHRAVLSLVAMAKSGNIGTPRTMQPDTVQQDSPSDQTSHITSGMNNVHIDPITNGSSILDTLLKGMPDSSNIPQHTGSASSIPHRPDMDPTIFLLPRHQSMLQGKCLDVIDFISQNVIDDHEHVLSEEGGNKIVIKSSSKKLKLESVNIWQWSVAAIRIMDHLMKSGELVGDNVRCYMAYLCKILELNSRFDWLSILFYDREYRIYQSQYGFIWGTDIPHLTTCFLKEKDFRFNGNQNQSQKPAFKKFEKQKQKQKSEQKCRDYNYKGNCTFVSCKYTHSCDVTGCTEKHPAINHVNPKNQ